MTELALNEHILVRKRYTRYCWMDFVRHAIIWVVSCVFITGNSPASAATVQDPVIAIHNADMEDVYKRQRLNDVGISGRR